MLKCLSLRLIDSECRTIITESCTDYYQTVPNSTRLGDSLSQCNNDRSPYEIGHYPTKIWGTKIVVIH